MCSVPLSQTDDCCVAWTVCAVRPVSLGLNCLLNPLWRRPSCPVNCTSTMNNAEDPATVRTQSVTCHAGVIESTAQWRGRRWCVGWLLGASSTAQSDPIVGWRGRERIQDGHAPCPPMEGSHGVLQTDLADGHNTTASTYLPSAGSLPILIGGPVIAESCPSCRCRPVLPAAPTPGRAAGACPRPCRASGSPAVSRACGAAGEPRVTASRQATPHRRLRPTPPPDPPRRPPALRCGG